MKLKSGDFANITDNNEWGDEGHKTPNGGVRIEELARGMNDGHHPRLVTRPSSTSSVSMPVIQAPVINPGPTPRSLRNVILIVVLGILIAAAGVAVALLSTKTTTPKVSVSVTSVEPVTVKAETPPSETHSVAERGISDKEILLGMSGPFSGPARDMGERIKLGLDLAISNINDEGGIFGRKIRLVALDDGYTPDKAAANVKELIVTKKVFAVLGSVGTPTAVAALPFVMERKTIFFGAMTGSDMLRKDPPYKYVFNYRASYAEETARIVDYLIKIRHLQDGSMAVFAQNDSYGDAGYKGVLQQLRSLSRSDTVLRVKYDRNSTDPEAAARELMDYHLAKGFESRSFKHPVKAIVLVGTYKITATFIQKLRDRGLTDVEFYSLSFVEGDSLAEALEEKGKLYCRGVTVMQVVPTPTSPTAEAIAYRNVLAKYRPDQKPGLTSFEGFTVMKLFAESLRRVGDNPTTDTVIDSLESINGLTNVTGVPLTLSHTMHQASHKVWASRLDQDCRFVETDLDQ